MNKSANLKDFIGVMCEQFDAGKRVSFVPHGNSMRPMLGDGTDMVVLEKPQGRLHFLDVALYYRRETDSYVVHRVVGFGKDGSYVMLGDNNIKREYDIRQQDIVAVMCAFYRKGKMYGSTHPLYRLYVNVWYYSRPLRRLFRCAKNVIGRNK